MTALPVATDALEPRRRRRWLLVAGVVVVLVVGVAVLAPKNAAEKTPAGEKAPDFTLERLDDPDETVSLAALAGRPVVLNFWASWCVPCRKELPAFSAVAQRLGSRVAFLGVDHLDGRRGALDLQKEMDLPYPSGYDPDGGVHSAYGFVGMPATVFISPDGRILKRHTGQLSQAELEQTIQERLGVTASQP